MKSLEASVRNNSPRAVHSAVSDRVRDFSPDSTVATRVYDPIWRIIHSSVYSLVLDSICMHFKTK